MRVVTNSGIYDSVTPENEASFEKDIIAHVPQIFGEGRYYIDCKRRIGKGNKFNIPDGYLLDLKRKQPSLFVVENELAAHDLFKHIGVQLLEFAHSYSQSGRQVKSILYEEIEKLPEIMKACEEYAKEKGYRNLDNLLDYLIFETNFQAIVIIDDETDELHSVIKQFRFPVEVIQFVTLEDGNRNRIYSFEPFLQDVGMSISAGIGRATDVGELDTIVVPARDDGFQETFINENRWYAIRMHSSMIPQIKHIAAYRVAPISAITHVTPINNIVPWKDTGKYCLEFAEPAYEIKYIKLDGGVKGLAPQASRYTSIDKLLQAKTISEVF